MNGKLGKGQWQLVYFAGKSYRRLSWLSRTFSLKNAQKWDRNGENWRHFPLALRIKAYLAIIDFIWIVSNFCHLKIPNPINPIRLHLKAHILTAFNLCKHFGMSLTCAHSFLNSAITWTLSERLFVLINWHLLITDIL